MAFEPVREAPRLRASRIKPAEGDGVASAEDPLNFPDFTLADMGSAVEAATSFNTYVIVYV